MKRYLRVDLTNPSFLPPVVELLRVLPPPILFHQKHRFRHPAAIYQLSLGQLAADFKRVLDPYSAIRLGAKEPADLGEQIARAQRILTYSLREHIDDCQMILMCLVDPTLIATTARSPDEKLKSAGFIEQKEFWDGVSSYLNGYIMPMVNALKHAQGRFRTVTFECSPSDLRPGFYLEEVDENEIAQPSLELHKRNSAFSFARDIRSNLGFIFRAAQSLDDAVRAALSRLGANTLETPVGAEIQPSAWASICKQVANLDYGVFPQELKQRFTRFSVLEDGSLRIRDLDPDTKLFFPKDPVRCYTQTLPDGVTKNFRMPYLGGNRPKIR
jgi:hypothetical protein